ncbi:putative tetratricopeptide-like helical domain-containing protein [Rosa chinensis]|uniref:Putative tetratricopeptide-like helical domain-containing protein n=1 Tax=Rosa chinensis TaxID=74649 RepID=A0A2P6PF83_ROSCH|nr:putative tetratricopeptide-like helical domain-containing protein [Rosa chinensis]
MTRFSELLYYLSQRMFKDARHLLEKMPNRDVHDSIVRWTCLVTKYSRCGWVDEARVLFDIMPERNMVTYNAMLSGYVQSGRNVESWTSMLCGLACEGRIEEARRLFEEMPERNVVSWNSMIAGLVKNGDLEGAREVFDWMRMKNVVSCNAMIGGKMRKRNVVSWTAMIGGFAWNGFYREALLLFLEWNGNYETRPNGETFISLVYACAGIWFPHLRKQLHAQLIVNNWDHVDYDGRLSKSLIHMLSSFL